MRLLIKFPESLGQMILLSPVLRVIKEKIKDAHITVVANEQGRDVFSEDPFIDDLWVVGDDIFGFNYFSLMWKKFKGQKFTHYVYFGGSRTANLVAFLRRIPIRAGRKGGFWNGIFLNRSQRQRRDLLEMHETEYNLNLLRPIGIEYIASEKAKLDTQVIVNKMSALKSFEEFKQTIGDEGIKLRDKFIFIHPGASGMHPHWSSRNFGRFIEKMEKHAPNTYTYIVSHTPKDEEFLKGIRYQLGKKKNQNLKNLVYYFDGSIKGLRHYMEVLSHSSLFLGHSTGAYYLANAIGVKTIGFYLPLQSVSPFRWAPFHRDASQTKIVLPQVVCAELENCTEHRCPYYECMDRIEVNNILEIAKSFLE